MPARASTTTNRVRTRASPARQGQRRRQPSHSRCWAVTKDKRTQDMSAKVGQSSGAPELCRFSQRLNAVRASNPSRLRKRRRRAQWAVLDINISRSGVVTGRSEKELAAQDSGAMYPTVEGLVGRTPLVRLQRLGTHLGRNNTVLLKLEGNNPAGSVKDRPAISMIREAESRGLIKPGDTLVEATSGNTGIALAMASAVKGYRLKLIMPRNMSEERKASMRAYGAELTLVGPGAMEEARDLALEMQARGEGRVLDQFANEDNPGSHIAGTGPEVWEDTRGTVTHFVSSMGTTGTIMGTSRFLKSKNPAIQIVGLQPAPGAAIPGIRRWSPEYLPKIFDASRVDRVMDISQREAEETTRALARVEGIMAGVSSGGAVSAALRLSDEVQGATICAIICDRGDRYLSTGIFGEEAAAKDPQPCTLSEWPSAAARLEHAYPGPHYVAFVASDDPETGEPWCGDVRQALPEAREAVETAGGTLLEVQVGMKAEWKDPTHPFRTDSRLELAGVPTLMRWQQGRWSERVDAALQGVTGEKARDTVLEFVARTK